MSRPAGILAAAPAPLSGTLATTPNLAPIGRWQRLPDPEAPGEAPILRRLRPCPRACCALHCGPPPQRGCVPRTRAAAHAAGPGGCAPRKLPTGMARPGPGPQDPGAAVAPLKQAELGQTAAGCQCAGRLSREAAPVK
jgi:hypothetical protein